MRAISATLMLATTLTVAAATNSVEAQVTTTSKPAKTGRVPANGIDYYDEIRGSGEPLLLLYGGLGSIDMFGPVGWSPARVRRRDRRLWLW